MYLLKINPKLELKYQKRKKDNITTTTANQLNKKAKVKYNKKAESEFFVDNSALAGFTGERILIYGSKRINRKFT